ncbi:MAG: hypothetical protein KGD59_02790 [Candidatus Heimdallarchaeota archaeon]|nr:hypothetical protein [Candidatus Heimdallarchaeota archaeon]
MNKALYYKYMFMVAGIGYIVAAIIFAIMAPVVPDSKYLLFFLGLSASPSIWIWLYSYLLAIMSLGFMYFLVSLDITKNHLVISAGMIFKISQFIVWLIIYVMGLSNLPLLIVAIVDLVFAVLFIEFFVNFKKLDPTDIVLAYPIRKES